MSGLLVLPSILVKDSFVDFNKCSLIPQNYGMIIYVSIMLFILPATVLAPIFIWYTNLNKQFHIRRDMSSDFLDDREEEDDEKGIGLTSSIGLGARRDSLKITSDTKKKEVKDECMHHKLE